MRWQLRLSSSAVHDVDLCDRVFINCCLSQVIKKLKNSVQIQCCVLKYVQVDPHAVAATPFCKLSSKMGFYTSKYPVEMGTTMLFVHIFYLFCKYYSPTQMVAAGAVNRPKKYVE